MVMGKANQSAVRRALAMANQMLRPIKNVWREVSLRREVSQSRTGSARLRRRTVCRPCSPRRCLRCRHRQKFNITPSVRQRDREPVRDVVEHGIVESEVERDLECSESRENAERVSLLDITQQCSAI